MVCLPRGEEHGNARDQRREHSRLGASETHGGGLKQAGQRAVETINAVVKQLAESTRCSGPSRLFSVDVIHRLVREEPEGKAEV